MADIDALLAPRRDAYRRKGEALCRALIGRGFSSAVFVQSADEARAAALEAIAPGETAALPGSVTTRQIGLPEALEAKGCKVITHWGQKLEPRAMAELKCAMIMADVNYMSFNAAVEDGTLVNIDGAGNRVAAMSWGPGRLVFIGSVNKICETLDAAMDRARNFATLPNVRRFDADTPCAKAGRCVRCESPNKLCRIVTIMEYAPMGRDCRAVIVGEDLGY